MSNAGLEILREALSLPGGAVMGDVMDQIYRFAVERRAFQQLCSKIIQDDDHAAVKAQATHLLGDQPPPKRTGVASELSDPGEIVQMVASLCTSVAQRFMAVSTVYRSEVQQARSSIADLCDENDRIRDELKRLKEADGVFSPPAHSVNNTALPALGDDRKIDMALRALCGSSKAWMATPEKGWTDPEKADTIDGELAAVMQQLVDAQAQVQDAELISQTNRELRRRLDAAVADNELLRTKNQQQRAELEELRQDMLESLNRAQGEGQAGYGALADSLAATRAELLLERHHRSLMEQKVLALQQEQQELRGEVGRAGGEAQSAVYRHDELTVFAETLCARNAQLVKNFEHVKQNAEDLDQIRGAQMDKLAQALENNQQQAKLIQQLRAADLEHKEALMAAEQRALQAQQTRPRRELWEAEIGRLQQQLVSTQAFLKASPKPRGRPRPASPAERPEPSKPQASSSPGSTRSRSNTAPAFPAELAAASEPDGHSAQQQHAQYLDPAAPQPQPPQRHRRSSEPAALQHSEPPEQHRTTPVQQRSQTPEPAAMLQRIQPLRQEQPRSEAYTRSVDPEQPRAAKHEATRVTPKASRGLSSKPRPGREHLMSIFKQYSRQSFGGTAASLTFAQISMESSIMDMEEFTRFMHHYQFVPAVYNRREINQIFAKHAQEHPGQGLTTQEFERCVGQCVATALSKYSSEGKKRELLPHPIAALGKTLKSPARERPSA